MGMRIALAMLLSISVFATAQTARASPDLASVVVQRCGSDSRAEYQRTVIVGGHAKARARLAAFEELCISRKVDWAKLQGQQYPRQYFWVQFGVDACADLQLIGRTADIDMTESVAAVCGVSRSRETAQPRSARGMAMVPGLASPLEVAPRQDVLENFLEHFGKPFCEIQIDTIAMNRWFMRSCEVMVPAGEIDARSFRVGALRSAFRDDLRTLPVDVAALVQPWIAQHAANEPYAVAVGIATYVVPVVMDGATPLELLATLGDKADDILKGKVRCDLTLNATPTTECVLLLGFELARTAAREWANDRTTPVSRIIDVTLDRFCADRAEIGRPECVVAKDRYEVWHRRLLATYRAVERLLDAERTMATMSASTTREQIRDQVASEIAHAVRLLIDSMIASAADAVPDERAKLLEDIALIDLTFDVLDAVLGDSPSALINALLATLTSKMVHRHPDGEIVHVVTGVVTVATAKDRNELVSVLSELTETSRGLTAARGTLILAFVIISVFVIFFLARRNPRLQRALNWMTPMIFRIDRRQPSKPPLPKQVILFLAANPRDTHPAELAEEYAAIERELLITPHRGDFELKQAWAVTVDDIARHLLVLQPTIIHFSGHGVDGASTTEPSSSNHRDIEPSRREASGIYVHDEHGGSQLITADGLKKMIESAQASARVVVLNACYSDSQAEAILGVVDCVVGMTGAIHVNGAREFAAAFYRALGNRRSVGQAVKHGVAILAAKQLPDELLPRCRTRDGVDANKLELGEAARLAS